ncbi:pirin family protein [Chelatococcus sambhunathii]|uniref:Pirin family protein n=1 Tax=Chelatococcus sambhunathii TaxID=363953 RepID=A0ABU1DB50_9HYPH|nr:pirin family protein [Chelatococcus sambhunathii]MDR4305340.1 pirin family protein [Chelatococcus sambhunathii]
MREVIGVYDAPRGHWVGDGFPVRSLFSHPTHGADVSPFLLLDYAGPADFPPADKPRGVDVHPHKGFETVTIVFEGEVEHHDSTGAGGKIGPGDVQWMTAASGILHKEFHSREFTKAGGRFEIVQLWVNLPAKDKGAEPGYQTLTAADIPTVELDGGAGKARVIAGELQGAKGPAKTFTPVNLWDVRLQAGKAATLTPPDGHTVMVVVLSGAVRVNGEETLRDAEFARLSREGGSFTIEAERDAKVLVLTGKPIDEPVVMHGPFVMNTVDEIREAIVDFQSGRFGEIAA